MKTLYILMAGLFNFVFGFLLYFVFILWFMSFLYIADAFGWVIDPTLDEGLLLFFLLLAITASGIYFPILILVNSFFRKKIDIKKLHYVLLNSSILIIGLLLFSGLIYSR